MYFLPDLVLQTILFRNRIPVELRFIICINYFPFLPNEGNILQKIELLYLSQKSDYRKKLPSRNVILLDEGMSSYTLDFTVLHKIVDFRIHLRNNYLQHSYLMRYTKQIFLDDCVKPHHPNICFYCPLFDTLAFQFKTTDITEENMESLHLSIVSWYRNIIYLAMNTPDVFSVLR